ncbi:MAG: metallophosphoesterase [Candidatus Thorarchaeota archaeon]
MSIVNIAAVADVHSPRFLSEFKTSLSEVSMPDVFLLAGDMVTFGRASEYWHVIQAIDSQLGSGFPIFACFGNEEYSGARDVILDLTAGKVTFLDEESVIVSPGESRLGIVGAHAPIDKRDYVVVSDNIDMRKVFERRTGRLSRLLKDTSKKADHMILLMHYSPILEIDDDTNRNRFSWWISRTIDEVAPDLVIHGHIHNPARRIVTIGKTRAINVAFPSRREVTEIAI